MIRRGVPGVIIAAVAASSLIGFGCSVASAAPPPPSPILTGPMVTLTTTEVAPGGRTVVTIDGFLSPYVTISICGNEARRGSADCNMSASEGVEVRQDEPLTVEMPIAAPPVDCPCVVRVVGEDANEVALAPITIVGHPIGPLVDPPAFGDLVAVTISAKQTPTGALEALRSDLGGRTTYEVTVRVKNLATTPLKQVGLSASAGQGENDDSLVSIDVDDPGLLAVGQTWQQIVTVDIPAPAFGSTEWRATVSGAGPTVVATSVTKHRPWLLIVLSVVLLVNLWLLFVRWRVRRRAARAEDDGPDAEAIDAAPDADDAALVGVAGHSLGIPATR